MTCRQTQHWDSSNIKFIQKLIKGTHWPLMECLLISSLRFCNSAAAFFCSSAALSLVRASSSAATAHTGHWISTTQKKSGQLAYLAYLTSNTLLACRQNCRNLAASPVDSPVISSVIQDCNATIVSHQRREASIT